MFSNIYFEPFSLKTRQENFELYQVFMHDFLQQNVSVLPYCIHQKHYSVKIGSIPFFSCSDMHKFHYILGCRAIDFNFLLIFF